MASLFQMTETRLAISFLHAKKSATRQSMGNVSQLPEALETKNHIIRAAICYGYPRQDIWIHQRRDELPVAVALGVGGAFDFVAGVTPRAPRWLRRLGLEWLYRLVRQPWRSRRMAALPLFALMVFMEWVRLRPTKP